VRVDVVIAAFERASMLAEAIHSVLNQTHTDLNLVVVDDASPQPLSQLLRVDDKRLQFLRLERNTGPGGARNAGVKLGDAPLVAFLDSDDLWQTAKLAKQVAEFEASPWLQWSHCNEEWQRHGKVVVQRSEHRKQGGAFLERAFGRCLIANSAVVFRRAFFEKHGGFNAHFPVCSDYELWLRMLADAPIGFSEEALVIKRAGDWPQVSSIPETDRYRVLALHRFYRQQRRRLISADLTDRLLAEAVSKCQILIKGAHKYGKPERARRYQAWLTLLTARRTRPMR
jgi:glycosyltransferase involved in cell wall biosynthesis